MTATTAKTTARAAYAEYAPYGLRTLCWTCDCVVKFASAAERDEWVADANDCTNHVEGVARAITLAEARETYRVQDITTCWGDPYLRGDFTKFEQTCVGYRRNQSRW